MTALNISSFIWGIADDVLRDIYVRGKYSAVILPMTVIRRLDAVLEPTKEEVPRMKARLDDAGALGRRLEYWGLRRRLHGEDRRIGLLRGSRCLACWASQSAAGGGVESPGHFQGQHCLRLEPRAPHQVSRVGVRIALLPLLHHTACGLLAHVLDEVKSKPHRVLLRGTYGQVAVHARVAKGHAEAPGVLFEGLQG